MDKRVFQCVKCKKIIEVDPTQKCGPSLLTGEKAPLHCGKPMIEIPED